MIAREARVAAATVAAACSIVLATGCSELPAGSLVWKQDLLGIKTALTSVVVYSPTDAIAIGHQLPEFALVARPLSLRFSGTGWAEIPMPAVRSTAVLAAAPDEEGSIWAVGRSVSTEAEPFDPTPLVYHFEAGTWSAVALDELGDQSGIVLTGVATAGRGADLDVRAVGDSINQAGRIYRYAGGHWSAMALPTDLEGAVWTVHAIAHTLGGAWYAVGRRAGETGGTILIDEGTGWRIVAGPAIDVDWTAVASDGRGVPYIAGNVPLATETQGVLYRQRRGSWVEVPIERRTSTTFHILGLGFDVEGNGWAVGGLDPGKPFFAGTTPSGWVESQVEAEVEAHPEAEEVTGGDMTGIAVHTENVAFAVGSALETGLEGESEFQPRIFRLTFRPAGETDLPPAPPSAP